VGDAHSFGARAILEVLRFSGLLFLLKRTFELFADVQNAE
jgi:hypothetical protein